MTSTPNATLPLMQDNGFQVCVLQDRHRVSSGQDLWRDSASYHLASIWTSVIQDIGTDNKLKFSSKSVEEADQININSLFRQQVKQE